MSVGRKALLKLLDRAESAWTRTGQIAATLRFSEAGNPEYIKLASHSEKQRYNATLLHAEQRGALSIQWDERAGHHNQVLRIELRDGDVLANLLDTVPRWRAVESARAQLAVLEDFPIVTILLDAWKNGKKPRNLSTADTARVLDAAKTLKHCWQNDQQDIPVRRLSTRLGFDSKRLEALIPALDLLCASDLDQPPRESEEVLAELGVVKHPLPVLLSGKAKVKLTSGSTFNLPVPYVGVAPNSVDTLILDDDCKLLLSVENLTTFHEVNSLYAQQALVIYSNGMPSPSWRRLYGRVIATLPADCQIFHWGDIDAGGFRIAARIGKVCQELGRTMRLHSMNPALLPEEYGWRNLEPKESAQIIRISKMMGWHEEAQGVENRPRAFEQEALDVILPALP